MLPKFVLMLAQAAAGWHLGHIVMEYVPFYPQRPYDMFVWAIVFAVLVWVIGFIGSAVLKDCGTPTSPTLTMTLVIALLGATITLVPEWSYAQQYTPRLADLVRRMPDALWWPLGGALIGYLLKEH